MQQASNHEKVQLINVVYPEAIRGLTAHFHPTPIGRAAATADTDRVVPVRSVAVGPTGGDSRSAIGSSTAPIGADNMYPMMHG